MLDFKTHNESERVAKIDYTQTPGLGDSEAYLQVLEVVSFIAIFPRVAAISHAVRLGVNILRSFRGQRTHLNGFLVKRFLFSVRTAPVPPTGTTLVEIRVCVCVFILGRGEQHVFRCQET